MAQSARLTDEASHYINRIQSHVEERNGEIAEAMDIPKSQLVEEGLRRLADDVGAVETETKPVTGGDSR